MSIQQRERDEPRIRPAPVRKSVYVPAPPERAFDVFANGIGRWWPKSHKIGSADLDQPIIEPRVGGRWYERGADGSECEIGKVAVWDPPSRLVLIWQLNAEWKFERQLETEVDVRFAPEGSGTRVDLEHRNLERLGETADSMRQAIDSPGGWSGLLALFAEQTAKSN
ncbi:MAG TPA: SRPBCC family protein [Sphingomicrobium sp.]|nr:SRPBCC family protein [Sphingomicrobium sp.]